MINGFNSEYTHKVRGHITMSNDLIKLRGHVCHIMHNVCIMYVTLSNVTLEMERQIY